MMAHSPSPEAQGTGISWLGSSLPAQETAAAGHEPLLMDLSPLRSKGSVLIVGGTFDPFTRAHLDVPRYTAEILGAAAVLYIPAKQNPLKAAGAHACESDRLSMIREALKEEPHSFVSPLELLRDGSSYTVETLRQVRGALGAAVKIFLFIGSDCVSRLPEWKGLEEIRQLATIVPVTRGEDPETSLASLRGKLDEAVIEDLRAHFVEMAVPDISATMARERLEQGELPWDLLPPAVAKYIEERGLYRYASHD